MKVLETLGRHAQTTQKGVFQYRRTHKGVEIDPTIGQALPTTVGASIITISHKQWEDILIGIDNAGAAVFRIQGSATPTPPQQDIDSIVQSAVPMLKGNTSLTSYVAAILEHEGTVDLFGGSLGAGNGAPILLVR